MSLENIEYYFTGSVDARRMEGGVKIMRLRVEKFKKLGWRPRLNSCEAIGKP